MVRATPNSSERARGFRAAETAGGKLNAWMDAVSAPNRTAKKPSRDFQEAWKRLRLARAFCVIWVVVC
jgi:hypothetical protein